MWECVIFSHLTYIGKVMFHILNQQDIICFSSLVSKGDPTLAYDFGCSIVSKIYISSFLLEH